MAQDPGFTVHDRRRVRPDEAGAGAQEPHGPLPPVDFSGFVLGLGQTAFVHLGEIPEPLTGERRADLDQARHTIDILDLLEEKTRGNLTPEEASLLQGLRSELKLRYVRAVHKPRA